MSVVRFGEEGSQVYIIHSSMGIECCGRNYVLGAKRRVPSFVSPVC